MSDGHAQPDGARLELRFLLLYAAIALCALSWLPLHGALPGNCDTWVSLAVSRGWVQTFASWFAHGEVYSAMHPAEPAVFYGESAPAAAVLFLFIDIFLSRASAIAALVALFLAGSAFGVFSLARTLGIERGAAFCGGLFFSTSNFVFANLDDSVLLFWLLPLLAVRELVLLWPERERIQRVSPRARFYRVALLLSLQLYFSVYVFIYGMAICTVLLIFQLFQSRNRIERRTTARSLVGPAATWVLLIAPWFAFYLRMRSSLQFTNPFFAEGVTRMCTLNLPDLLSALPGNRLRPEAEPQWTLYWSEVRRHAYLGMVPLATSVMGLFEGRRIRAVGMSFVVVGLLLSTAPTFSDETAKMHSITALLQQVSDLALFLRVPLRGYFLTGAGVALLSAGGLQFLVCKLGIRRPVLAAAVFVPLVAFHLYENVPRDVAEFAIADYVQPPAALVEFGETHPDAIIAQIPSQLGFDFLDSELPIFRYSREIIYFLWQADHGLRTVNGVNGYVSSARVEANALLSKPLSPAALDRLTRDFGVTHLVIHRPLAINHWEKFGVTDDAWRCLSRLPLESSDLEIFRIREGACEP